MAIVFNKWKHMIAKAKKSSKARETVSKAKGSRNFIIPILNFEATDYTDLID